MDEPRQVFSGVVGSGKGIKRFEPLEESKAVPKVEGMLADNGSCLVLGLVVS